MSGDDRNADALDMVKAAADLRHRKVTFAVGTQPTGQETVIQAKDQVAYGFELVNANGFVRLRDCGRVFIDDCPTVTMILAHVQAG
jgi:hypothetical protein